MGDGVTAAIAGQQTPDGYYKLDRILSIVPRRSTMDELTDMTLAADKVLVF